MHYRIICQHGSVGRYLCTLNFLNMLEEVTTGRPDEFKGEIAIDYTSTYFDRFCDKHIDRKKYHPVGVSFSIFQGELHVAIIAIPHGQEKKEGKQPVVRLETKATLEEFAHSFVILQAECFQYKQSREDFYEVELKEEEQD